MEGFAAFYVLVAVHGDGSLLADFRPDGLVPLPPFPMWLVFHPPLHDRTVPVMSGHNISMGLLPPEVHSALTVRRVSPCAPSCLRLPRVPRLSLRHRISLVVLVIAVAPLRRALHGDTAAFQSLVGPSGDISSKMFLNNIRNL